MLDPPDFNNDSINQLGTCHLKRLCQGPLTRLDEPKCEYILLLPQTRFGTDDNNNVILCCSNNSIRECHATININRQKNIYEILAQNGASVYVNGNQIDCLKPYSLSLADCILFGDKLSNSFTFQLEIANNKIEYPIMRQDSTENLILFDNSLNYQIGNFNNERQLIFNLLNCPPSNIHSLLQNLSYSTKENLLNYKTTPPFNNFIDVDDGSSVQTSVQTSVYIPPVMSQPINKLELDTKFDVDIFEVVKRIANRIAKQSIEELTSNVENNEEMGNHQFPMIAPASNINVYPSVCSTTLTPSTSSSPPTFGSLDFRHTPSTSSSFNNSDNSVNESNTFPSTHFTPSPIFVDEEEEELKPHIISESIENEDLISENPNDKSDEKCPQSRTSLQILAALASKNFKEDDKPLEIFIPLACSDGDESLSPTQTVKSEKILSPSASISANKHPKHRSSRQSTHDAEDSHTHTTKQMRIQAGIELCKRRMFKYIANNMYTSQIVKIGQISRQLTSEVTTDNEEINNDITNEQTIIEKSDLDAPKPLNLYLNGEDYVTIPTKPRRNSKKQTMLLENYTEADHRLFATLLLQLQPPRGPSSSNSTSSSITSLQETTIEDFQPKSNEESIFNNNNSEENQKVIDSVPKRPSKLEEQMFLEAERQIPRIKGVGRHMAAKYRFLYRAELDRSSAESLPTQRHKLLSRCKENRVKFEEKQKQIQRKQAGATRRKSTTKRSVDQLPSPNASRNPSGLKSPAKTSTTKKNSTARRQSTDFNGLSIYQLAKDPNFDGFLSEELHYKASKCSDPFNFEEEEDSFGQKIKSPPNSINSINSTNSASYRPFFATENARSAAISASVAMHNQQQKKSRKRQQSGNLDKSIPTTEKPTKRQRISAPRAKRGRQPGRGVQKAATIDKEEPCAFDECSPQQVQMVARTSAIEWVACDSCNSWLHCLCALGLNRPVGEQEKFQCRRCLQN